MPESPDWLPGSPSATSLAIDLGDAIANYLAVKERHDAARDACDHDWDYFGHYETTQLKSAAAELGLALVAFMSRAEGVRIGDAQ